MKTFKTAMSIEEAREALLEIGRRDATDVSSIDMGELSRVFTFREGQRDYVLHIRAEEIQLQKMKFISSEFGGRLLIPKVVQSGSLGDGYYMVTERAAGVPLSTLGGAELEAVVPDLIGRFRDIHAIVPDVPDGEASTGFGWIGPQGKAYHSSWQESLLHSFDANSEGFYEGWTELFERGILEKDVFDHYYEKLGEFLQFAPTRPSLVHGDFHTGNMLAAKGKMTAIVDWEMAMYGDFMYDVAIMHMWTPQIGFPIRLRTEMEAAGHHIPHFEKRLTGYQLYRSIDALRFYAKKEDPHAYQFMKQRLSELVK